MTAWLGLLALLVLAAPPRADLGLPSGFTSEVYVTGQGFDTSGERGLVGIPAVGTIGIDATGTLYLARTGARFRSGDVEDLWAIYRVPAGGARLNPDTESRYLYGPPLAEPADRRGVGSRARVGDDVRPGAKDRRPLPVPGPEAGSVRRRAAGRGRGAAPAPSRGRGGRFRGPRLRGGPRGGRRSSGWTPGAPWSTPRHAKIMRPRTLLADEAGNLWVGGDGTAETPFGGGTARSGASRPTAAPTSCSRGPCRRAWRMSPGGTPVRRPASHRAALRAHPRRPPSRFRHRQERQLLPELWRSPRSRRRRGRPASPETSSSSSSRARCG